MHCPNCGVDQPDRSKFCNQCGHPVPFVERTEAARSPGPVVKREPPVLPRMETRPPAPGLSHKLAAVVLFAVCLLAMFVLAVGPKQPCIANHRPLESCPSPGWTNIAVGLIGVIGFGSAAKVWSGKS